MRLPGVFGWFQRNPRIFYVSGITIMVLGLGAAIFRPGGTPQGDTSATPTAEAEVADGTATPDGDSDGDADDASTQLTYDAPPPMSIDASHRYEAVIRTERGDVRVELLPDRAPGYVNNFIFLAREGFYDGLAFHRVVPGFVAQAGDPPGVPDGPGYTLSVERNSLPFEAGALGMATSPTTGAVSGSQFFVTLADAPHLNAGFTVFGRVIEGMEVLSALTPRDPAAADQPPGDRILSIEIIDPDEGA